MLEQRESFLIQRLGISAIGSFGIEQRDIVQCFGQQRFIHIGIFNGQCSGGIQCQVIVLTGMMGHTAFLQVTSRIGLPLAVSGVQGCAFLDITHGRVRLIVQDEAPEETEAILGQVITAELLCLFALLKRLAGLDICLMVLVELLDALVDIALAAKQRIGFGQISCEDTLAHLCVEFVDLVVINFGVVFRHLTYQRFVALLLLIKLLQGVVVFLLSDAVLLL